MTTYASAYRHYLQRSVRRPELRPQRRRARPKHRQLLRGSRGRRRHCTGGHGRLWRAPGCSMSRAGRAHGNAYVSRLLAPAAAAAARGARAARAPAAAPRRRAPRRQVARAAAGGTRHSTALQHPAAAAATGTRPPRRCWSPPPRAAAAPACHSMTRPGPRRGTPRCGRAPTAAPPAAAPRAPAPPSSRNPPQHARRSCQHAPRSQTSATPAPAGGSRQHPGERVRAASTPFTAGVGCTVHATANPLLTVNKHTKKVKCQCSDRSATSLQ